jgi:hypothetical protein
MQANSNQEMGKSRNPPPSGGAPHTPMFWWNPRKSISIPLGGGAPAGGSRGSGSRPSLPRAGTETAPRAGGASPLERLAITRREGLDAAGLPRSACRPSHFVDTLVLQSQLSLARAAKSEPLRRTQAVHHARRGPNHQTLPSEPHFFPGVLSALCGAGVCLTAAIASVAWWNSTLASTKLANPITRRQKTIAHLFFF